MRLQGHDFGRQNLWDYGLPETISSKQKAEQVRLDVMSRH